LLLWYAGLEGLLLGSLLLEALVLLLAGEASKLRLQLLLGLLSKAGLLGLLRLLLLLLLAKALRLSGIAGELLLHWLHRGASKACLLRLQTKARLLWLHAALEAWLLAERLLLRLRLLAILLLRRPSGAIPTP
jgi:hypothetical protein